MKDYNFFKTVTCFVVFFILLGMNVSCKSKLPVKELTIRKADGSVVTVKAEMAVKPEERNFGFMERKNIPEGTGMLFVFEYDQILNFWMKNTPTALSIAYIASSGKIKDIKDMQPYSLQDVTSSGYVRYALEVPQGWYKKKGIAPGDTLVIDF